MYTNLTEKLEFFHKKRKLPIDTQSSQCYHRNVLKGKETNMYFATSVIVIIGIMGVLLVVRHSRGDIML